MNEKLKNRFIATGFQKIAIPIIVLLAISNVGTLMWFFIERSGEQEWTNNKFSMIDPARNFVKQEHYLGTIEPLRKAVQNFVASENISASIYIEFLNTGANISINPDFRFWPASLAKVPIAVATMSAIEDGLWTLDQKFTLEEEDKDKNSSRLHEYPTGTVFSVSELLTEMLTRSDNTAYRILLRNLPLSKIEGMKSAIGLEELFDKDGRISAKEYSRFFRMLYSSSYLKRENSQYLLELLDRSEFREFLKAEVPDGVPFPHKYGENPSAHAYNDSGIVYVPSRPYLITIVMQGDGKPDEKERVKKVMRHISKISYAYFSQAK